VSVHVGRGLPRALQRMVDRLAAELEATGAGEGTVAIAVDDSLLPGADSTRPLLVVPVCGPGRPTPWGEALVRAADAVALLDAVEARGLHTAIRERPLMVAGLPAPEPREPGVGIDPGTAPNAMREAWRRLGDEHAAARAGVAWISGRGLGPLAEALEAWAAGQAVVALPDVPRHDLLRRGRALHASSPLEAIEATRFLLGTPALAQALGARGREVAAALPSARRVALRLLEGAELARQSAGVAS
jgi:hypothetical protein